jgi:hypothetical protein
MKKRSGWALLLALMAMASALCAALVFASFLRVELRAAGSAENSARLRAAAEQAARRGLAELQRLAGRDAVATYADRAGRLQVIDGRDGAQGPSGVWSEDEIRWSWELTDLTQGFDAASRDEASRRASAWARSPAGRQRLPLALAAEALGSWCSTALQVGDEAMFRAAAAGSLRGSSFQTRGLLTDPVRGGWRRDLAEPAELARQLGPGLAAMLTRRDLSVDARNGLPMGRCRENGREWRHLPVPVDFRLSMGFFNARSDGRHRMRFHGSGLVWNPSSVPVLAAALGRMYLVELEGCPEVTVTNLDSGAGFTVNLDECPVEDFGFIRQGLREKGVWFWMEAADADTCGMSGRGLLAGEAYAFLNPLAETQPQGLSRILTRETWRMETQPHSRSWRRPSPAVFLPGDRIDIKVRFPEKLTVRLRPAAGDPAKESLIADYPSAPVIVFDNVAFPDFTLSTTGEDYSREDSAGYVIAERRACLRFRLRPRTVPELWSTGGALVRRDYWDFDDPNDAAEWMVDHPILAALDVSDFDSSPLMGPLWDGAPNRHEAARVGAFAGVRLFDPLFAPYLSVASLRRLEPLARRTWTTRLDSHYFSAPLAAPEFGATSHNPWLLPGASPMVAGPFNVNCRDVEAWAALLQATDGSWVPDSGGPFVAAQLAGPKFFTQPGGAGTAKWGAPARVDLADAAFPGQTQSEWETVASQQGVRQVDRELLLRLAAKIVELQEKHGYPFRSLEAWAESGLLDQAMIAAGVNEPVLRATGDAPVLLRGDDLLEAWASLLVVRGDTFRIRGRAESGRGGVCACEWVVQRIPAEHAEAALGRRFVIISSRILHD